MIFEHLIQSGIDHETRQSGSAESVERADSVRQFVAVRTESERRWKLQRYADFDANFDPFCPISSPSPKKDIMALKSLVGNSEYQSQRWSNLAFGWRPSVVTKGFPSLPKANQGRKGCLGLVPRLQGGNVPFPSGSLLGVSRDDSNQKTLFSCFKMQCINATFSVS